MWTPEVNVWCLSPNSVSDFGQGLSLTLELASLARLTGQEESGILLSHPSQDLALRCFYHAGIFTWNAYSSPATCIVSTLTTEPFLQPHTLHFNLSSFREHMNYFKYGEASMDMQTQFSTQTKVFINTGVVGYFTFETPAKSLLDFIAVHLY